MCVCSAISVASDSVTPWTVAHQAPPSMGFSWQEYGVGCQALLQGVLLTQRFNPQRLCLLHCRQILYPLSHQGKNYDHPQNVPPHGFFSLGNFTRFGQWPHLYNEQMEPGLFPSGPSLKHAHLNGLVLGFFGGLRESSANMETQLLNWQSEEIRVSFCRVLKSYWCESTWPTKKSVERIFFSN